MIHIVQEPFKPKFLPISTFKPVLGDTFINQDGIVYIVVSDTRCIGVRQRYPLNTTPVFDCLTADIHTPVIPTDITMTVK